MSRRLAIAVLLVAAGLAAGLILTGRLRSAQESIALPAPAPSPPESQRPLAAAPGALPDFTRVAALAVRSVTNISSTQVIRTPNSPFANDPFFRYFFGDEGDFFGSHDRREASLGSGVIVSPDGYVLTNNHVVGSHVGEIAVALADKREMRATLVGTDEWTDIALLKLSAAGLPVILWGDSSQLKVAEWVLAIGNPFQLSQTVTLGIVSAVGRANVGVATYEDFIQTDAAINPGNSGGALVNARGELVGINTAIYSQSGGYQGVGFAVPSNLARRVMNDLIRFGEVRRGSIGSIQIAPLTTQLAEDLELPDTRGAFISRMRRDSEAYRAGIRPGDVVVAFNQTSIDDPSHLLRVLSDAPIGSTATIGLVRGGRRMTVQVRVARQSRPRAR